MKREDVDRILNSIKGNKPTARASITSERLAALCRRWLEVEDAEVAHVEPKNGLAVLHERCMPLAMIGQRVRIVPEQGEVEGG